MIPSAFWNLWARNKIFIYEQFVVFEWTEQLKSGCEFQFYGNLREPTGTYGNLREPTGTFNLNFCAIFWFVVFSLCLLDVL